MKKIITFGLVFLILVSSVFATTKYWNAHNANLSIGNMFFDETNNRIGIGISTPSSLLDLRLNTADRLIYSYNSNISGDGVQIQTAGTNPADFVLRLYTGIGEAMWVGNNGSVGIGTATPDNKLEIEDNSNQNFTIKIDNQYSTAVGNMVGIDFSLKRDIGGDDPRASVRAIAEEPTWPQTSLTFSTFHSSDGLKEKMRITSAGRVGIGTTTPGKTLDIVATSGPTIRVWDGSSNQLQMRGDTRSIFSYGGDLNLIAGDTGNNITFKTESTERMRITDDGKVGIGTSNPVAKFEVADGGIRISKAGAAGVADGGFLQFSDDADAQAIMQIDSSGGLAFWTDIAGGVWETAMTIANTGYVGIGTAAPNQKLSVGDGNIQIISSVTKTVDTIGYLTANNNGYEIARIEFYNPNSGWANHGDIIFSTHQGANGLQEEMRIKDSGNVGIGTNSPNYALGIHKSAVTSNYLQITNTDTGTTASDGLAIGIDSEEGVIIAQQENLPMRFFTNNLERVQINAAGFTDFDKAVSFGDGTVATLNSTGGIAVTESFQYIDTFGGAATDDCTSIGPGTNVGQILVLEQYVSIRDITFVDSTDLLLAGDYVMDDSSDTITLIWNGGKWVELSRSDN